MGLPMSVPSGFDPSRAPSPAYLEVNINDV